jgi:hypothetical protein
MQFQLMNAKLKVEISRWQRIKSKYSSRLTALPTTRIIDAARVRGAAFSTAEALEKYPMAWARFQFRPSMQLAKSSGPFNS